MSATIQISSICRNVSLGLTYDNIKTAINSYHDRQKLDPLKNEARDLLNGRLRPPSYTERDDRSLVKLVAFGYELLMLHSLGLSTGNSDRKHILGRRQEAKKQLEPLRSLENRLAEGLVPETETSFIEALKSKHKAWCNSLEKQVDWVVEVFKNDS